MVRRRGVGGGEGGFRPAARGRPERGSVPELVQTLVAPLLPRESRYRLRQQRIGEKAARKAISVLSLPDVSVISLGSVVGAGSWREADPVPESRTSRRAGSAAASCLADAAGVVYREYRVDTGGRRLSIHALNGEVLFPRSARWVRVIRYNHVESRISSW